jgi:hypothetical protein
VHDRYLLSAPELHDRLSVMLGGRAAEELVFGTVSTGAHDDLTRATALARRMVTEFGMSEALGPVAFGDGRPRFLRQSLDEVDRLPVSEATATLIDDEVRRIVARDYERARSVLAERRETLDVLAQELIEREVLGGRTLAPASPNSRRGAVRRALTTKSGSAASSRPVARRDAVPRRAEGALGACPLAPRSRFLLGLGVLEERLPQLLESRRPDEVPPGVVVVRYGGEPHALRGAAEPLVALLRRVGEHRLRRPSRPSVGAHGSPPRARLAGIPTPTL